MVIVVHNLVIHVGDVSRPIRSLRKSCIVTDAKVTMQASNSVRNHYHSGLDIINIHWIVPYSYRDSTHVILFTRT